ncbi:hypothetical protein CWRG_01548 [Chthonomonas calidirosea]|uniref:hypothetical protein n=1 Tax=Chthonomonas calidirosea TaxID=454171 RepID=UPI0006DD4368|nr:hypothetical protein [Chthonomonas calidirosea]CEK16608.1 hypothetical protein CWRG_01548 [Chthonomonas calidirosea]
MVEPAVYETEEAEKRIAPPDPRQRGRKQVFAAALVALIAFGFAVFVPHRPNSAATGLTEAKLQGSWVLQSIGKTATGPQSGCPILDQQVTFAHGVVTGTTRLLADTPDGTTQMPFPDKSVQQVSSDDDGQTLLICWQGTYELKGPHRLWLKIGKASYPIDAQIDPKTHALICSHDLILTYPNATRYVPVKP